MSSGMKGGGKTTVTQDNEPPVWSRPLFEQSATAAKDLYNSGAGFNIWPGSTVAQPSEATQMGAQGLTNVATAPESWDLSQNPVQLTNQVMNQGGVMAPSQMAMGLFGNVAEGGMNPGTGGFQSAMDSAWNPQMQRATNLYRQAGEGGFDTGAGGMFSQLGQQAMGGQAGDAGIGQFASGQNSLSTQPFWDVHNQAQQFGTQAQGMFDPFRTGQFGINTGIFGNLGQQAQGAQPGDQTLQGISSGQQSVGTGPLGSLAREAASNPALFEMMQRIGSGRTGLDTSAFSGLQNQALGPWAGSDALGQAAQGGMNVGTGVFDRMRNQAMGGTSADAILAQIMGGQQGINTGQDFRDIYGRAQAPGAAQKYLKATARGDHLAEGNPHFRAMLEREADRLGDQVSGMFAGHGRYGSGAHQGVMGDTVSDFMLRGLSDDFSRERNLQMQAAQAIEAAQQGRLGQQQGAIQGATSVEGMNLANRLGAAGQMNQDFLSRLGLGGQFAGQAAGIDLANVGNRLGAASQLGAQQAQQLGLAGQFAGQQLGFEGQNLANQMGAQQAMQQQRQQGLGLASDIFGQQAGIQGDNLNRAMAASGQLNQDALQRLGLAGQFAGQGASFQGQNIANQMGAAGAQAGIGQNLLQQLQSLAQSSTGLDADNLARQFGALQTQRGFAGQDIDRAMQAAQGVQGADAQNAGFALQGAGGLAGMGQNQFQNLMSGAQGLYGAEQQNLQNQMGAAQSASGISSQGLQNALGYMGALPTVQQNRTFAPNLMMQSGAMQDQANQAQLNDMIRRFYEQDMQPWTRLGALQAAAQGSAGEYGTVQKVMQQPSQFNPLGLFGGAMQMAMPFFGG